MPAAPTLAMLTAAPDTVTVNGRTTTLYPLTMADVGQWNRWARAAFLEPILQATAGLEADMRRNAQQAAFQSAKEISFFDRPAWPIMDTTEGLLKTIELSLAHSKAPPADLASLFRNENGVLSSVALSEAAWTIYALSGYVSTKRLLQVLGRAEPDEKKTETMTPATGS